METRRSAGIAGCIVTLALLLVGCVNPASKWDDYLDRLPDAAVQPDAEILLEIPDVSGRFLLSIATVVDVDRPVMFIVDNTLHPNPDGSVTIDTTLQPLNYVTKMPVGQPLVFTDVPISMTGQFELTDTDVTLPGESNPISGSPLALSTVTLTPIIKNTDLYCGAVAGTLTEPLNLDLAGSTMGAVRVPAGAVGDALPEPVGQCPVDTTTPDAGAPDATPTPTTDAGVTVDADRGQQTQP